MNYTYTIVDYFGYDLSGPDRMRAIRKAGFDGVILLWADYFDPDYRDFPRYAADAGLFVENAHAPYKDANTIWEATAAGEEYTEHLIRCVRDCAELHIPTLVMHPINGMHPLPADPQIGLAQLRRILEAAESCGVTLAAENQGNPAYLDLVLKSITSERLGFCYDSGHERYFSPGRDLLADYGDRLCALHLHDNDGTHDAHMLPFTGAVDFKRIGAHLTRIGYGGAVALETQNTGFAEMTDPVEFLHLALAYAKMIS